MISVSSREIGPRSKIMPTSTAMMDEINTHKKLAQIYTTKECIGDQSPMQSMPFEMFC